MISALFIGPDYAEALNHSELLLLPELRKAKCSVPDLPVSLKTYVMVKDQSGVILCGGLMEGFRLPDCFKWVFGSKDWLGFPAIPSMKGKREYAKGVQLGELWWVTGGYDGNNVLASTELRQADGTWKTHENLPEASYHHCMTRVNDTHVILVGGYNRRAVMRATYLYSIKTGWKKLKDMKAGRYLHSCTMIDQDRLLVTGGYNTYQTTEVYTLSRDEWRPGPSLPKNNYGGKMITFDEKSYLIGGHNFDTEIYHLEPTGSVWWKWTKVAQLAKRKRQYDAVAISMPECDSE